MQRLLVSVLLLMAGCGSVWDRHTTHLGELETQGEFGQAAAEQRWLIDNAFVHAPAGQNSPKAEATRYLHLADLAAKADNPRLAVEALREALTVDPHQAPAVRTRIDQLPVSAAERARLQREFAWNIAAMAPSDDAVLQTDPAPVACRSYRVQEVRVRHQRTLRTTDGLERQVAYDTRAWVFGAESGEWHVDGGWNDAGAEAELVDGPPRPRYRAVLAADHGFIAEAAVPDCHRNAWQGPYDHNGSLFVTARLPGRQDGARH